MNTTTQNINWTKITHDINGNPRYVCHFFALNTEEEINSTTLSVSEKYQIAVKRANKIGGRKYHTKKYGGGIVFQTYETRETEQYINKILNESK
jgi:hypothetical protein